MKTKADIRTLYKQKRQSLSALQIEELSIAIANQALQLDIWQHTYYHLFLSIARHKEVDTAMLLHALQGKDKQVVVSKTNFKTHTLSHFLLTDATAIKENAWGIPEPQEGLEVPVNKIDVVFVPLLAFDRHGHRVGYGKGFYDRFLRQCRGNTLKIGLSFFDALDSTLTPNAHDVALDGVITPEKHYWFN
ncbi:5-formyltetrahydrofolate cyclo-ligase [Flavobacteriaceae bacterium 14752]|uniref:5-formyltetrahydrofolate cyclo-ligase n=1 Tax=Mesohalobacter salilacus TaxID=2491711 RepID=UPI000F6326D3|nr:5-formyltetrahydrofolate cyclo-ligase [Flavobacteriaceae bacterium 14752]